MDDHPEVKAADTPAAAPAYLIFFLSGAAALVYEVSWARQVGLLFGHTAHAAAVVLTAYFAGLAVGYAVGGRLARRVRSLRAYAVAEFVAAGWACLIPLLLSAAGTSGAGFLHHPAPAAQLAVRWVFCFLLLLPATAALGATLPLIAEWLSPAGRPAAARVTSAYAANTAGAFVGVVGATAWLLVAVGVVGSGYLAAGLSLACGLAAIVLHRFDRRPTGGANTPASPPGEADNPAMWSLVSAALAGFGILALEVLYTRMFSLVFHNSTYTFGTVLAAVLAALALGSLLAGRAVRVASPRALVVWAAWAGGVATVVSVVVFVRATGLEYFRSGDSFAAYMGGAFGLVALVVLPPVAALGTILPAVWHRDTNDGSGAGGPVGRTTVVNTLAAAAGAVCANFVLLPHLGLWAAFVLVAALFVLPAVAALAGSRPLAAVLSGLVFVFLAVPLVSPPGPERWATVPDNEVLVRRWDSAYGWVDVVKASDGAMKVRQNMHYRFGTTGADAPRAYRQAHVPLLLHPRPADVLFMGLGTGLTAAGALPHPEVERAVVVELVPEVVDAARLLADANRGVVDHPKVEVRVGDARHFLHATDRRFDVIVSDLFIPWESETGYLYTVEHYRTAKGRLKPGGLFCQWLPVYQLGPREFEMIADSFAAVFPDVSLWWGHLDARRPIVALVGGDAPMTADASSVEDRLERLWKVVPVDGEIRTARDVFGLYLGHWQPRRPDRLNTDEHPRVEFLTPVSHRDRTLLHGDALRRYYDDVFARLPDPLLGHSRGTGARRAGHRLALFPQ